MKQKNGTRNIIIAALVLIVVCIGAWLLYQNFAPKSTAGEKSITVTVIHEDHSKNEFSYYTNEEYLGPVLTDNKLVEGENGQYGLFITSADGEAADDSKQQWWCLTKAGEQVNTSADKTPITDGDTYELTLTEGY